MAFRFVTELIFYSPHHCPPDQIHIRILRDTGCISKQYYQTTLHPTLRPFLAHDHSHLTVTNLYFLHQRHRIIASPPLLLESNTWPEPFANHKSSNQWRIEIRSLDFACFQCADIYLFWIGTRCGENVQQLLQSCWPQKVLGIFLEPEVYTCLFFVI